LEFESRTSCCWIFRTRSPLSASIEFVTRHDELANKWREMT
jgi:hypothetical protein